MTSCRGMFCGQVKNVLLRKLKRDKNFNITIIFLLRSLSGWTLTNPKRVQCPMKLKPNTFCSLPRVFVYYHWLKKKMTGLLLLKLSNWCTKMGRLKSNLCYLNISSIASIVFFRKLSYGDSFFFCFATLISLCHWVKKS